MLTAQVKRKKQMEHETSASPVEVWMAAVNLGDAAQLCMCRWRSPCTSIAEWIVNADRRDACVDANESLSSSAALFRLSSIL